MSSSSLEFNGTTPCWRLLPFFLWASPPPVFSLSGPEGRMTAGMFMWDAHSIIPQNIFVASSFLLEHASSGGHRDRLQQFLPLVVRRIGALAARLIAAVVLPMGRIRYHPDDGRAPPLALETRHVRAATLVGRRSARSQRAVRDRHSRGIGVVCWREAGQRARACRPSRFIHIPPRLGGCGRAISPTRGASP